MQLQPKSVYIMGTDTDSFRLLKIGISSNVEKRIQAMRSASGLELKVLYYTDLMSNAYYIEKMAHEHFKEYNFSGEWFDVDIKEVIEYLESKQEEYKDIEQIEAPHKEIEIKDIIKEIKKMPEIDYTIFNNHIGVIGYKPRRGLDEKAYFIEYVFKGFHVILCTYYVDIAKKYAHKLRFLTLPLTKYIRDDQEK